MTPDDVTNPTISIPGCPVALEFEPCEVAWLEDEYNWVPWKPGSDSWCRKGAQRAYVEYAVNPEFIEDQVFAAVYECGLRDVVLAECAKWGVLSLQVIEDGKDACLDLVMPVYRTEYESQFSTDGPTRLHTLRTAAQHLKVGPWIVTEKETP